MDMDTANKFYRLIKNGMTLKDIENKLGIKEVEVMGMIELCNIYGKQIELVVDNNECCVVKKSSIKKTSKELKPSLDELIHTKLCIVSDTHLGNNRQQLHLLNKVYEEAYKREIDTVLHCGDLVDGDYTSVRKEQKRLNFLLGFDQQCGYVVDMYPSVNGITTKFILGSHDETHFKNGGATIEKWLPKCRKDMIFLGQDTADIVIDKVKITMDHPGDGCAQGLSYKPQKRIDILEVGAKPSVLLIGHYHKSYYFNYRNVNALMVPALCDKTQFQQKKMLTNVMGAYFLDIYSDEKGNIQYFIPEEMSFGHNDVWDEAGKDMKKVKRLSI